MRTYKVVILADLMFGLGLLCGYLWWNGETDQLRRELDAARATAARAGAERSSAMGIVRAVLPKEGIVIITHEPFGTMPAMTMGFRAKDRRIMTGLAPGDRVEFTAARAGADLELIALRKER